MSRILIGSSLNEKGLNPIEIGINWGKQFNSRPHVLHVDPVNEFNTLDFIFNQDSLEFHQNYIKSIVDSNQLTFERYIKNLNIDPDDVLFESKTGYISDELCLEANKEDVDFMVVGYDPEKGWGHLFLGEPTEGVIHKTEKSILITKDLKALNPKKILCAYDFTSNCNAALDWIVRLGHSFNADVELYNIIPSYYESYQAAHSIYDGFQFQVEQDLETSIKEVELRLERIIRKLDSDISITIKADVDTHGDIAKKLSHHAQEIDADVLVLGSHLRGRMSEVLLGSITHKLIKDAPCSIFIAK